MDPEPCLSPGSEAPRLPQPRQLRRVPLFLRSILASSNRIASSPTLACACFSNRASGSPCRRFSPSAPLSKNVRRHASSSCAGTYSSRLTAPTLSRRNKRNTTSVFAFASTAPAARPRAPVRSPPSLTLTPWTPRNSPNACPRKSGAYLDKSFPLS